MPPVTAERSPPDSRITGADSPVIADSSTEPTPSTISPSAGITSPARHDHDVAALELGRRDLAERAVRGAPVRDASSSASRAARSPAPCRVPRRSPRRSSRTAPSATARSRSTPTNQSWSSVAAREVEEEDHGRDHAADLDDEHHRVAPLEARVELRERVADRRDDDVAREDAGGCAGHYACLLLVECEVELEDVDARLAEEARASGRRCCRRSAAGRSRAAGGGRRRSGAPAAARTPARCRGSMPEPEVVTASTGMSWIVRPGLYGRSSFRIALRPPAARSWRGPGSSGRGSRRSCRRRCRRARSPTGARGSSAGS